MAQALVDRLYEVERFRELASAGSAKRLHLLNVISARRGNLHDVYDVVIIRKQLYLEEAQDKALKQRARELGVSEAEVVRRALDEALLGEKRQNIAARQALESFLGRAARLAKTHAMPDGYRFDRQDLYDDDERFKRWDKQE